MSLRKDPRSPYWQYDFQFKKRRFHGSTGCTAKRDAQRYEDEVRRKAALGEDERPGITLDDAAERFWLDKARRDKNANDTQRMLGNVVGMIGPKRMVSSIRNRDFDAFIEKRLKTGVSNATVNREVQLARRMWRFILLRGYDLPVPGTDKAVDFATLMLPEPKERVRSLSAEDEAKLLAALGDDLRAMVEFAILSGQRRGALTGLRWDRIDFAGARAEVHTKGDQWHSFPLTDRMVEILLMQPRVDGCPFVFTYKCTRPSPARKDRAGRHKGIRYPYSEEGWYREWKRALNAAGIEDFRFHDLRHTSATRVMRATGNLKVVQRMLGHTDISTTARYAHVNEDDVRAGMSAANLRNNHGEVLPESGENTSISADLKGGC